MSCKAPLSFGKQEWFGVIEKVVLCRALELRRSMMAYPWSWNNPGRGAGEAEVSDAAVAICLAGSSSASP